MRLESEGRKVRNNQGANCALTGSDIAILDDSLSPYDNKQGETIKSLTPVGASICQLFMLARPIEEISRRLSVSGTMVRAVLASDPGRKELERLRGFLDEEFKALQYEVNNTIRDAVTDSDKKVALQGAKLWMLGMGKGQATTNVAVQINNTPVDLDKYRIRRDD